MDVDSLEENKQLFFQSCKDGSLATVQQLLTHSDLRAHIDSLTDDDGNTALIVASENGHKGIVKLLLECGANVDKRTPNGWTALMKASERGDSNLEVIELLLRYGAQADLQNNEGDSALIVATQNRQTELVIKLVRYHRANVDLKNNKGWTALMKASQVGHVEVVELLLNTGAEVDQQSSDGYSALMLASQNGHTRLVKLLLKFRAKVDIKANNSTTALVLASQQKHTETVELLLEYGAKDNLDITLAYVAANKEVHRNTIKLLLEHGAKADYRQWWIPSALEGASENGRMDIVKLLLDHGSHEFLGLAVVRASRNGHIYIVKLFLEHMHDADDLGWALVEAILNKHSDIIELLLQHGAQVDEDDWFDILDEPPLIIAVEKGDTDMVKLLLEHGAKQELGWAITEAIWNEHPEIIQLLSEHSAQVDDDDRFEWAMLDEPTLVTASKNGNTNVVKLLLEHGAKMHLGWALTEAILNRHADIVHILIEHGAQVDHERDVNMEFEEPALTEAVINGHIDSVKLLLKHGANQYLGDALIGAIFQKNIEIIKVLLEYGALEDDEFIDPPLVVAAENGDIDIVKLLLDRDGAKKYLDYALAVASNQGHSEIIEFLLECGAKIDDANALVVASENGRTDVVQLLLVHGSRQYLPALIAASQRGYNEIIKLLLDTSVKVNGVHTTVYGEQCALMSASKNGQIETVELLLQHGADVNLKNKRGLSALMLASQNGHIKVTKLLLERGAQINLQDEDGCSALILASQNRQVEIVQLLLQHGAQVNLQKTNGLCALVLACLNWCFEIIKMLLEHGAQVNLQDTDGSSALMLASKKGDTEAVKLLLQKIAQVNLQNNDGHSALMLACENGHIDITKQLLQHGSQINMQNYDGWSALILACHNGHNEVVRLLLIQFNVDVNLQRSNGWCALMSASQNGHSEIVKLLLQHSAQVNLQKNDGWTALMAASQKGHMKAVMLLLQHGAEVNMQKTDGSSALLSGSGHGHTNVVELLLEYGALQDLQTKDGWSALMAASQNGYIEVVKLLLQNGAQVNLQKNNKWSALMSACQSGHTNIVKLLLEYGARVGLLEDSWSPLMLATQNGFTEIVSLLFLHGAQIDLQKKQGWDVLMAASNKKYSKLVLLLLEHGAKQRLRSMSVEIDINMTHAESISLLLECGIRENLQSALILASQKGNTDVMQLLLHNGAQVNHQISGKFAITEASRNGHTEAVKLLLKNNATMQFALIEACRGGHTEVVKLLLENGAGVNILIDNGCSALMVASQNGYAQIMLMLLEKDTQINLSDNDGWSALMKACANGHIEVTKLLIAHDATINHQSYDGWSAVMAASHNGSIEIIKLLLKHNANVRLYNSNGKSALMIASEKGHTEIVEILLSYDDKVNLQDIDGVSAFMLASQNGHTEVIKLLQSHGANIVLQDNRGWSALMKASDKGHTAVTKFLIQHGSPVNQLSCDGRSSLMAASHNGHTETVELLLKHGSKVNVVNSSGHSALALASKNGHFEVIKLLLKYDVQVDIKDRNGTSAFMLASQNGHVKIVSVLIESGANVQLRDNHGSSALMKSCANGYLEVANLLLKSGAIVNEQDNDGCTSLVAASVSGHTKIVTTLLEHGAQVDLQNNDGLSPLMKASENGRINVVKQLLNHGTQVNLQSKNGYHALMIASEAGYIEVVNQLMKHGADVDLEDNEGNSAVIVARNTDILSALFGSMNIMEHQHQNESQNEPESEKDQEAHLTAIVAAIRDRGKLDHTLVHGVFVGPPRSGKDTLMKRLLGEMPTKLSPSTGVAENVVHVRVERSSTFAATVELSNWARLAYDEEAIHLMMTASKERSNTDELSGERNSYEVTTSSEITQDGTANTLHHMVEKISHTNITTSSQNLVPQFMPVQEEQIPLFRTPAHPLPTSKHKSAIEIFKDAIMNTGLKGFKRQLAKSWSLYLTNTGGQMEFQELLPLLVSGPSIFFVTFQLHKDLLERFPVEYELPSGESSKSYQSSMSILEAILQTLSSISAMGTFVYQGLQRNDVPLQPKVFIIGTHKDMLDKNSAETKIVNIDKCLREKIESTSHYREGIIHFASESQMIFTVNNLDPNDSDFQIIRSAVEQVLETGAYRMRSPTHWMIFSLVLRQQLQCHVETYNKCYAIAKECGIRDTKEFCEALHFIHTKMGLIRYFPYEELEDIVIIDPQILFEKITELIVETFTFEKVGKHSMETFKNKGIFSLSDFERMSNQTGQHLTPKLFAKLLEHLRIAAPLQQDGEKKYFLSCVLAHAQIKDTAQNSTVPPLIVTFQCGFCPKGLFGTLITYLIANEMQSDFEWELLTDQIFRDEVSFQVGPYDTVTLRLSTTHLEIICAASNPELLRMHCTEEVIFKEVHQSLEKGITTVTSAINYIKAQHTFTFYCTSESCSKDSPHPAKLKRFKGKLCSLKCDKLKNKSFPLPPGFEKWQLDSSPQALEPTTEVCHDPKVKLDKCHCSSLISHLSNCAAKWREIGTHLEFQQGELNNIQAKPLLLSGAPQSWLSELLSEWMEWAPGDSRGSTKYSTLEDLKSAVSKAGFGVVAAGLSHQLLQGITGGDSSQSTSIGNKRKSSSTEMLSEWLEWAPGDQRGSKQYATLEALKRAVSSEGLGATAENLTINIESTSKDVKEISYLTSKESDVIHRTTSENYLYSAKKCVTPYFLDEIKNVQFDSFGLEHKVSGYDITVRIPESAIPKGQTVYLKVGAALNGPFKSSSGKRPISPILWLCPEGEFTLSKPIEIVLPHILTNVTTEDVRKFGIQVAKTNHENFSIPPDNQIHYMFKPFEVNEMKFESNTTGNYVVMKVTHCCFLCLEAYRPEQMTPEVAQAMAKKKGYCMHCIECLQSPYPCWPPKEVIIFCVSFFMEKCIEVNYYNYHSILTKSPLLYCRLLQSNIPKEMTKGN